MSEHLDKARQALVDARRWEPGDLVYQDLLTIARVQAEIAQASALERIADALDGRASQVDLRTVALADG